MSFSIILPNQQTVFLWLSMLFGPELSASIPHVILWGRRKLPRHKNLQVVTPISMAFRIDVGVTVDAEVGKNATTQGILFVGPGAKSLTKL